TPRAAPCLPRPLQARHPTTMVATHPLALTREQLALIQSAADAVPAKWRERFLLAVQDALLGRDPVLNADVLAAVGRLRARCSWAPVHQASATTKAVAGVPF